ncbi:MAG: hypothetical protein H6810_11290 [Phycisphaeraceae bacterium]|nr:MAG: hypothetical protein H6810_11290 [Phycisphaeraceae bacterium]
MSTPAKSFDNLRSILGKLDRKIDHARSKRLGLDQEPDHELVDESPTIGASETVDAEIVEDQAASNGDARHRSPFGRAKPLNRNGLGGPGNWIGGAGVG